MIDSVYSVASARTSRQLCDFERFEKKELGYHFYSRVKQENEI